MNFISSKDSGETRIMHTKSDNIEIMMDSETNDVIDELFWISFAKISRSIGRIHERQRVSSR